MTTSGKCRLKADRYKTAMRVFVVLTAAAAVGGICLLSKYAQTTVALYHLLVTGPLIALAAYFMCREVIWRDREAYWEERESKEESVRRSRYREYKQRRKELDKLTEEELDEMVHDAKGNEAACINNEGRESQYSYLIGEPPLKLWTQL